MEDRDRPLGGDALEERPEDEIPHACAIGDQNAKVQRR
jgi:hypothetical protein